MKVTLRTQRGEFNPNWDRVSQRLAARLTAVDTAAGGLSTRMAL